MVGVATATILSPAISFARATAAIQGVTFVLPNDAQPGITVATDPPPVASGTGEPVPNPGSLPDARSVGIRLQGMLTDVRVETLRSLLLTWAGPTCLIALAAGLFGWLMPPRMLKPLGDITGAARRLSAETLHERIKLEGPRDELKELAGTFDGMLGRLDAHRFQEVQRHQDVVAAREVTERLLTVCPHGPDRREAERERDVARPLVKQQVLKACRRVAIARPRDSDREHQQGDCEGEDTEGLNTCDVTLSQPGPFSVQRFVRRRNQRGLT